MPIYDKQNDDSNPLLIADALMQDKRVAQAKELLLQALKEHQKQILGISAPKRALQEKYAHDIDTFSAHRGAPLWHPYIGSGMGRGALVELADGSIKYDFISGIGVHYWGHSHPDLLLSGIDAALSNTVMQGNLQQNREAFELTALLLKQSGLDHCFLTTTGAMANENALKIAFQKKYPAHRVLAFERTFTGRTLALSQITDKPSFREGLPLNLFVDYLPFFDPRAPEESTKCTLRALDTLVRRYPKQHAVMCFELIQGEGGFYQGTQHFYEEVMKVLKTHQIAILSDEVQCFGRTNELFAFHSFGLESYIDIVTIGKLSQVCATLFTQEYKPQTGLLSQTFIGSSSALKASLVIINGLLKGGYFGAEGKIAQLSEHFVTQLQQFSKEYPTLMQGPFGSGAMIAFTPFDGDAKKAIRFVHQLFEAGVISFIAGSDPTRVRFLMPVGAIDQTDIDCVVQIIKDTLTICKE